MFKHEKLFCLFPKFFKLTYFRLRMNFDVHNNDDIDIIKHEINTPASVISLEEIDRILEPRSVAKHECVMNKVNEIQVPTERCTLRRPAYLDIDRICSHYVIHYMKRFVLNLYSKVRST